MLQQHFGHLSAGQEVSRNSPLGYLSVHARALPQSGDGTLAPHNPIRVTRVSLRGSWSVVAMTQYVLGSKLPLRGEVSTCLNQTDALPVNPCIVCACSIFTAPSQSTVQKHSSHRALPRPATKMTPPKAFDFTGEVAIVTGAGSRMNGTSPTVNLGACIDVWRVSQVRLATAELPPYYSRDRGPR
jgi:hypothetical protein